jgi:hypothetical protein
MRAACVVLSAVLVLAPGAVIASDEPPVPERTAEHAELGMWVGSWSGTGEMKPGPFGPGGEMSWTEECSWFEGSEFHVVCRSEGTSPMGPSKGLGIIGYKAATGRYTHYGVDNTGWSGYAEGTREGDTWTYHSEEVMAGETYKTRYTVTMESPTRVSFTWSMSDDGGETWTLMMDGTSEKR